MVDVDVDVDIDVDVDRKQAFRRQPVTACFCWTATGWRKGPTPRRRSRGQPPDRPPHFRYGYNGTSRMGGKGYLYGLLIVREGVGGVLHTYMRFFFFVCPCVDGCLRSLLARLMIPGLGMYGCTYVRLSLSVFHLSRWEKFQDEDRGEEKGKGGVIGCIYLLASRGVLLSSSAVVK